MGDRVDGLSTNLSAKPENDLLDGDERWQWYRSAILVLGELRVVNPSFLNGPRERIVSKEDGVDKLEGSASVEKGRHTGQNRVHLSA